MDLRQRHHLGSPGGQTVIAKLLIAYVLSCFVVVGWLWYMIVRTEERRDLW